ncbi:hypothetical protein GCM10020331_091400 [Ectobacillus funiculus]
MQIHNYREKESHTNPDIDKDRTQLNYDLLNDSRIDFKQAIQSEIDERYTGNKAIRKDAVMLCEFVVTSDKDFFDRLDPDEEKNAFSRKLFFSSRPLRERKIFYMELSIKTRKHPICMSVWCRSRMMANCPRTRFSENGIAAASKINSMSM